MISIAPQFPVQISKLESLPKQHAEPDFSAFLESVNEESINALKNLSCDVAEGAHIVQYNQAPLLHSIDDIQLDVVDAVNAVNAVDVFELLPYELSDSQFPAVRETVHVVQKEMLISPWRLMAGYNLDYSTARVQDNVGLTGSRQSAAPSFSMALYLPVSKHPLESISLLESSKRSFESVMPQKLINGAVSSAPRSELEHITSARYELLAHSSEWSRQVLRWTANAEGGETVWVRDYSLTPEQVNAMASEIRKAAYEQTILLTTIMINGRQVWRNENTLSEKQ